MPHFTRFRSPAGLAVLASAALAALIVLSRVPGESEAMTSSGPLVAFADTPQTESATRDGDIAFYSSRVAQDRQSATDRLTLARLLFTRSRSAGSTRDLSHAETLARESIALRDHRNGQAFEVLASILMARHAFREAHAVAVTVDSLEPATPSHLALLGEIELELGRYEAAAAHFRAVVSDGQQFTTDARVARWYELTGHATIARAMLHRAIVAVDRRDDLPQEQRAWFHYRLGELELRLGRHAAADTAFQEALRRHPDDVRALGGLARNALASGNFRRAIEYGDRATAIQLDPTTLATVSLAYTALGDSAQAAQYASAMSVSALTQPGAIHRAWGLYLLDHGSASQRADVLRRARAELRERGDVYGHDLLAWALFRAGRPREARRQMHLALAQGTEDIMLRSHAQTILGAN